MKTQGKNLEIKYCDTCLEFCDITSTCTLEDKRVTTDSYAIPDWCPLPDVTKNINEKISELLEISDELPFVNFSSHDMQNFFKIKNTFTKFNSDIKLLCPTSEGFEKAVDKAIEFLTKEKENFYGKTDI